jgi:hypothetical protein
VKNESDQSSGSAFDKYRNPDPRCGYPFTPDPCGYCWSFAHHVDGTGCIDMDKICPRCELWKIVNNKPTRIQRKRQRGYDMQRDSMERNGLMAVNVCRPGPWGNPFIVGKHGTAARCVELYENLLAGLLCISIDHECVEAQVRSVKYAMEHIRELRGKNLACWCPEGKPCHADVLLDLANAKAQPPKVG